MKQVEDLVCYINQGNKILLNQFKSKKFKNQNFCVTIKVIFDMGKNVK